MGKKRVLATASINMRKYASIEPTQVISTNRFYLFSKLSVFSFDLFSQLRIASQSFIRKLINVCHFFYSNTIVYLNYITKN